MSTHSTDRTAVFESLSQLLEKRFSTAQAVRDHHAKDESWHPPQAPDAVCFPESTEEVSEIVRTCAAHGMPIVPFGAGTSLEGHLMAAHGGVSVLFTGDIEEDGEAALMPYGEYLRSTVLKVPHHGSDTSSTPFFVSLVDPEVAVISCGRNNKFGHPAASVVKRFYRRGVNVYRTDIVGDVTLWSDGWSYRITTESVNEQL